MNKWDNFWLGVAIGLVLPALFCVAYAYTLHLPEFFGQDMWDMLKPVVGRMFLLAGFVNMAVTFVLYEFSLWHLAKGVLIAILPYMTAGVALV